jgi:hypothetical protein
MVVAKEGGGTGMDILPAAFYGGIAAFVIGTLGAIVGLPLSDTARYSKRTERIVYLVFGLSGGVVACAAWLLGRLSGH